MHVNRSDFTTSRFLKAANLDVPRTTAPLARVTREPLMRSVPGPSSSVHGDAASGPVLRVLARLQGVRRTGSGWMAQCPSHDDGCASLSVGEGADGRALVFCHSGCGVQFVVAKLGLAMR